MGLLERLRHMLEPEAAVARAAQDELHVAAAVLLVEAARMDDEFDPAERARIEALLAQRFGLEADESRALLAQAERTAAETVEWQGYTRVIKERLAPAERVSVIEMLWEVVYADGRLHDYEASLLRRITGLLYVSDWESGEARKRVLARLGLD
jgi:uncharacterized tellurite resistance protein B-like protein